MIKFCMDDMVPQNHMLRLIDKAIDWTFIYDFVEEKYCPDIAKQRYITNDGKPYTVSPYTLIWDGDYYYMRGFL